MSAGEAQAVWRTSVVAVIKANPGKIRLGAINTPMPAAYKGAGLLVTVRQSGWRTLDNHEFVVSAWQDGGVASFPDLTLQGCDLTGEAGANPPNIANTIIEIRPSVANTHRYPREV